MIRRRWVAISLVLASLLWAQPWTPPAAARPSSLPTVGSGRRPGPTVLYKAAPHAPQLENRDPHFKADPLLVAGTEGYADGEYRYQDYIYDDWGANTQADDTAGADSAGDIDYPLDRGHYGSNSADLVEFRIAPTGRDVAYRITLNQLISRDSTIAVIAIDTDRDAETGTAMLPVDPGALFPGTDEVITTWGTGATHARSTTSGWRIQSVEVSTDIRANQITVIVPRYLSNPRGKWRFTVATGLYNNFDGTWLRPQFGAPGPDAPGGGMPDGSTSGIFNLAFRFNEKPAGRTPMDVEQADALADGEPTRFARVIDFRKLDGHLTLTTAPRNGTIVRIFPSRIDTDGGKDYTTTPETRGQLQQYSLYVPRSYQPGKQAGLTLMLHSLGEHHWQYNGSIGVQQVGERRGNLVLTPEARGEDGWYQAEAEYDVFEAWNDVARRYTLNPNRAAVTGYSMGGYGTYRFASLWPDLFGAAFSTVGPPADGIWVPPLPPSGGQETNTNVWLENTRNVRFLNAVGMLDELVPYAGTRAQNLGAPEHGIRGFEQLGYRYRFITYPTGEHFTIALLSYDTPYAVDFLGTARVNRDPRHVTFSYAPVTDYGRLGLVHDHAYWVSKVRLADKRSAEVAKATVDAFSHATGYADPALVRVTNAGVGPIPYVEVGNDWADRPKRIRKQNKITLNLTNVRSLRLDVARAGIDASKPITLDVRTSDITTIDVRAPGADWKLRVTPGHRILRLR
ncbi:MAG TPA: hypothetical protein VFA34_16375 [Actinomycetota bacterium]|jgi:hypothetical protein|nr:hypothetical protein [Actinomycetota bacterium]